MPYLYVPLGSFAIILPIYNTYIQDGQTYKVTNAEEFD